MTEGNARFRGNSTYNVIGGEENGSGIAEIYGHRHLALKSGEGRATRHRMGALGLIRWTIAGRWGMILQGAVDDRDRIGV